MDVFERQSAAMDDIRDGLTRVMADIGSLRGRLQGDFKSNYAVSDLESYLNAMQFHATNLSCRMDATRLETADIPRIPRRAAGRGDRHASNTSNSSSMGDEPDSAIDINDGPPSPCQKSPRRFMLGNRSPPRPAEEDTNSPAPPVATSVPIFQVDDFLDELGEHPGSRPPSPPPRARGRSKSPPACSTYNPTSALSPFSDGNLPGIARSSSVTRSVSEYSAMVQDSEGNTVVPKRMSSIRSGAESEEEAASTLGDLMTIRSPPRKAPRPPPGHDGSDGNGGTAVRKSRSSTIPPSTRESRMGINGSRLFGRKNSFSVPARPTRPGSAQGSTRGPTLSNLALDAARPETPAREVVARASPHHPPPTAQNTTTRHFPRPSISTVASKAGSVRSTSSRLSSVFSRVSFWKHRDEAAAAAAAAEEELEPDDIFGVSLKKSMQVASASVRTHHDGSKSSSRREFPRCVLVCVSFIRDNGGVRVPNIFGGDSSLSPGGDSNNNNNKARVLALKEAFSTPPSYGDGNVDWSGHDVFDAADLVVLFLQQLRRPLITEAVAKRWIVMSKQATLPGSMGIRTDSCLDFWDEALLGVRGAARSLFKLLLNLWGDIADAQELNDMTAERLAACLLNPLMHLPSGKYTTDYMLGLAFLIRKRSEYSIMLREGRKSHAAF